MKKIYYLTMSLALATMVGCQNENDALNVKDEVSDMAFTASFESNDSRTALQGDNNNVIWVEGDKLSVFAGKTVNKPYVLEEGGGTNYGTFTFDNLSAGTSTNTSSSTELSANVAYYPYCQDVTVSESNGSFTFNATFPIEQIYSESGTFGNGASPMVAVTANNLDDELMFKNVGGIFRLQLQDDANVSSPTIISKIVFSAENANLAGKYQVTTSNNTTSQTLNVTEGSSTITLDCGEGVQLSSSTPTNFVVAMLPVSIASGGLTIIIYDTEGKKQTYVHSENAFFILGRSEAKTTSVVTYNGTETAITNEANLRAALSTTTSESTKNIVVEDDIILEEPLSIESGNDVTLNLNGKTLTLGDDAGGRAAAITEYGLINNGTLTLANGTIEASEDYIAAIRNNGTLTISNSTINAVNRGIINCGTATLDCNITSEKSNAVCGYGDTENVITINGGTYTASKTTPKTSAVRMDPRVGGVPTGSDKDFGWHLTINGGTFVSEEWVALEMLDNYYNLGDAAGWAKIDGGTFTGSADHADIGGVAVQGITISNACVLTNEIIKNQTSAETIKYDCIMNGYNLQDKENHYNEVFISGVFTNGGEFTLTDNASFTEALTVPKGKTVTLNLGNYTLTSTDDLAAIINDGTITLSSYTEGGIEASYRGLINRGTATLKCNITSENSNAVCGYGDTKNVITIDGGTYTASKTTEKASALRMDPREGGDPANGAVDFGWHLTINGGTFISEKWVALEMLDNYYGLEDAGWAKIYAGTFTGNDNCADIGGVAVENIEINTDDCDLNIIKNQTKEGNEIEYSCKMNGYDLQDRENHYTEVKAAYENKTAQQ